jgi:hypothetical protein
LILILQLLNHQEICVDTSEEILFVFFCLLNRRKFFFFLCLEYIVVQWQLPRQSSNYSLLSNFDLFSLLWPELAFILMNITTLVAASIRHRILFVNLFFLKLRLPLIALLFNRDHHSFLPEVHHLYLQILSNLDIIELVHKALASYFAYLEILRYLFKMLRLQDFNLQGDTEVHNCFQPITFVCFLLQRVVSSIELHLEEPGKSKGIG